MTSSAPKVSGRIDILGCGVDDVDMSESIARIRGFLDSGAAAQVVTLGAEMVMLAQRDAAYREVINSADLVIPDTVGIVWASHRFGHPLRERVAGIDLVEQIIGDVDLPVFLVGGAEGVARYAADSLKARHPHMHIAGVHHGYLTETESSGIVAAVRASGARVVLVALGFPRQEFWIHENLARLGNAVCIGVGGAFDVWAGKVRRAPPVFRTLGMEWLYRLITQPRRLRRQLALPEFAARVITSRPR